MIKLIAFDWNGTLLSDTATTLKSSNRSFKRYGLKPVSILKFRQTFTIPIISYWTANGLTKKIDFIEQSTFFHSDYNEAANFTRTRAGTKLLLNWLKSNHIQSIIFSNHVTPEITKQLIRLNIFEFINEVFARPAGDHSHVFNRSKEQKLFEYIKLNKIKPQEVISVGDTEEEIQVGKQYGYHTVAITGGYNTAARLKKQSPDYLIHNLKNLIPIIKKLNKK